jgi:hypothetical protein
MLCAQRKPLAQNIKFQLNGVYKLNYNKNEIPMVDCDNVALKEPH